MRDKFINLCFRIYVQIKRINCDADSNFRSKKEKERFLKYFLRRKWSEPGGGSPTGLLTINQFQFSNAW